MLSSLPLVVFDVFKIFSSELMHIVDHWSGKVINLIGLNSELNLIGLRIN